MENLVELKREELIKVEGGNMWMWFWYGGEYLNRNGGKSIYERQIATGVER